MEHTVIFRKEQRMNSFGKLGSTGGRSELVAYHSHLFIRFGKTEHGLGKILSVAIQPGRPQNKIPVRKILYKVFSCQLGRAICALRIGGIRFHIRPRPFSVKHIIRRYMHQLCSGFPCRNAQVSGSYGVDLESLVILCLTGIHSGMCRAIDNGIRLHFPGQLHNLINIGNIQLSNIRI